MEVDLVMVIDLVIDQVIDLVIGVLVELRDLAVFQVLHLKELVEALQCREDILLVGSCLGNSPLAGP